MAAFSSLSFSTSSFSDQSFDFGAAPAPQVTGGHFGEDYRKRLERLERITRTKEITAPVIEAAQEVIEAVPDIQTPQLEIIAKSPEAINLIDYEALSLEIQAIQDYLSSLSMYSDLVYDQMNELDDELAILLMVN
jgi:hypothetical protein